MDKETANQRKAMREVTTQLVQSNAKSDTKWIHSYVQSDSKLVNSDVKNDRKLVRSDGKLVQEKTNLLWSDRKLLQRNKTLVLLTHEQETILTTHKLGVI